MGVLVYYFIQSIIGGGGGSGRGNIGGSGGRGRGGGERGTSGPSGQMNSMGGGRNFERFDRVLDKESHAIQNRKIYSVHF